MITQFLSERTAGKMFIKVCCENYAAIITL